MGTAYRQIESLRVGSLHPQQTSGGPSARRGVGLADARLPEFFATDGSPIRITTDSNGHLSSAEGTGKDGVKRELAINLLSAQVSAGTFIDRFVSLRTAFHSSADVTGILTVSLSLLSKQMVINALQVDGPQLKYVIDFSVAMPSRPAVVTRTVSFDGSVGYSQHGSMNLQTQKTDLPLGMDGVVPQLVSGLDFFSSVFNYFGTEYWTELTAVWGQNGISPPDGLNALYDLSIPQKANITKFLVRVLLAAIFGAVAGALGTFSGGATSAALAALSFNTTLGAEIGALGAAAVDVGDIIIDEFFGTGKGGTSTDGGGGNSNVAPSSSGNPDPAAEDGKLKPKKKDGPTG